MSEKKQETTQELYQRVHNKFYKMYKNIAMQIKIADEVIKEVKERELEMTKIEELEAKIEKLTNIIIKQRNLKDKSV